MHGVWLETSGSRSGDDLQMLAVKEEQTVKILLWNYHFERPREATGSLRVTGLQTGMQYTARLATLDATTVDEVLKSDEIAATEWLLAGSDGTVDIPLRALPFGVYAVQLSPVR
jgi:hypothetical protein